LRTFLCLFALLAGAAPGGAQSANHPLESFWESLNERALRRCEPSTSAWTEAQAALGALDRQVQALKDPDPIEPALERLVALLKTECFLMASEAARFPAPDTALSLKQWWDHGGRAWLESYLEIPEFGLIDAPKRHVVVPPDARQTLRAGGGAEALEPLLCRLGDAGCGADTRGWRARIEAFLDDHRVREWSDDARGPFLERNDVVAKECDDKATADKSPGRYRRWRGCIDGRREKRYVLPLGETKAPDTGWLLVWGRRGHYSFCDAISAFDLATGASHVSESCSGLALVEGGHVDLAATARQARLTSRHGKIRVENLREAAWALLMMTRAEEVQTDAEYYPLPPDLVSAFEDADGLGGVYTSGGGWWGTTAQTRLDWQWIRGNRMQAAGELTWPNSANGVEEHAARLLDIAERSFVEGCPDVAPPSVESLRDRGAETPPPFKELVAAFQAWRTEPPCRAGKPRGGPR
jgi:hypothetical protein